VAYGATGFLPSLPEVGQSAIEIAALRDELRAMEWLPAAASSTDT